MNSLINNSTLLGVIGNSPAGAPYRLGLNIGFYASIFAIVIAIILIIVYFVDQNKIALGFGIGILVIGIAGAVASKYGYKKITGGSEIDGCGCGGKEEGEIDDGKELTAEENLDLIKDIFDKLDMQEKYLELVDNKTREEALIAVLTNIDKPTAEQMLKKYKSNREDIDNNLKKLKSFNKDISSNMFKFIMIFMDN